MQKKETGSIFHSQLVPDIKLGILPVFTVTEMISVSPVVGLGGLGFESDKVSCIF